MFLEVVGKFLLRYKRGVFRLVDVGGGFSW